LVSDEGFGDAAEGGIETDSHVTVIWGLLDDNSQQVADVVDGFGTFELEFKRTMIFEIEDMDVVVVEVHSPELEALHELLLKSLPNEQTYDEYRPHLTLAYVKQGTGAKYGDLEVPLLTGEQYEVDGVEFSDRDGNKTEISL